MYLYEMFKYPEDTLKKKDRPTLFKSLELMLYAMLDHYPVIFKTNSSAPGRFLQQFEDVFDYRNAIRFNPQEMGLGSLEIETDWTSEKPLILALTTDITELLQYSHSLRSFIIATNNDDDDPIFNNLENFVLVDIRDNKINGIETRGFPSNLDTNFESLIITMVNTILDDAYGHISSVKQTEVVNKLSVQLTSSELQEAVAFVQDEMDQKRMISTSIMKMFFMGLLDVSKNLIISLGKIVSLSAQYGKQEVSGSNLINALGYNGGASVERILLFIMNHFSEKRVLEIVSESHNIQSFYTSIYGGGFF